MRLSPSAPLPLLALFLFACHKDVKQTATPSGSGTAPAGSSKQRAQLARYSGPEYSKSIPLDVANGLIGSYLNSVKYPQQDTAIRSFAFDADTLRAYLADTSIKTIRFYMAHTPAYSESNNGKYAGLDPKALTLIIAGYSTEDNLIKNSQGGVYDHCYPCPHNCQGSGLLQ